MRNVQASFEFALQFDDEGRTGKNTRQVGIIPEAGSLGANTGKSVLWDIQHKSMLYHLFCTLRLTLFPTREGGVEAQ
jgi:hypothetical protein